MKLFFVLPALLFFTDPAWSDATLYYELQNPHGKQKQIKISISGEMVRIDESSNENSALIFQAGHLFPLYQVNYKQNTYQRLTPEFKPYLRVEKDREPSKDLFSYPPIHLQSSRKQQIVVNIKCHLAHELVNEKPSIEHCLANAARVGLSERETRSLVRTYATLRKHHDAGWPGAGTLNEKYVSVRSRHLNGGNSLELKSVSDKILNPEYFRIPREYELVTSQKEQ